MAFTVVQRNRDPNDRSLIVTSTPAIDWLVVEENNHDRRGLILRWSQESQIGESLAVIIGGHEAVVFNNGPKAAVISKISVKTETRFWIERGGPGAQSAVESQAVSPLAVGAEGEVRKVRSLPKEP